MAIDLIPQDVRDRYIVLEVRHACAVLATDFPNEFADLLACLREFKLVRSEIVVGGGGKSKIAARFDHYLAAHGWGEKKVAVGMTVDGVTRDLETHKVDFLKGRVAIEVEWNNKDPFYSRDLNAFRLLHDLNVISAGVIITRADELQDLFDELGYNTEGALIGAKYGASTTHWSKLMPRVESGGNGTCPLLLFGIKRACYVDDLPGVPIRHEA